MQAPPWALFFRPAKKRPGWSRTPLAQSPAGTISGTVSDSSEGVISGARITILINGLSRTYITEANGVYTAAALPVGRYEVRAEAKGFSTWQNNVDLT
jgi:hypothetical protein